MKDGLKEQIKQVALLRGDFTLSSGSKSSYYLDKYLFETKPEILRNVAAMMSALVPEQADRLGGPELGGVPLVTAVSLRTGLPFVIFRRRAKDYSTGRRVEGELRKGDNVVIIEDILTTGSQAIQAAETAREVGAEVLMILAVIDREEGACENIAAAGFQGRCLINRTDLGL